ncbi:MAG: hydrogen peroxide-dependent heme synthase [Acidimicrobiaceae bacterium]|nr:hydrogen peroxide-dependent heme synthase [Acidimicrobiaceae bacterium]
MPEPLTPSTGWGVLHLFCKIRPGVDAEAIVSAVKSAQATGHQVVSFAVLGHKADLGFLAIGPDLWRLRALQAALQQAGLDVADSYVSLTEVSEYAKGMPQEMLDARLYPNLPPEGKTAICFYPMSKRRGDAHNWYTLPFDDRAELMQGHGKTGRTFSGRILQLITGSAGLDDFEWGVTLFGVRPDDLKDTVYTMRFDEASSLYAEFGPFYTGLIAEVEEVLRQVGLAT